MRSLPLSFGLLALAACNGDVNTPIDTDADTDVDGIGALVVTPCDVVENDFGVVEVRTLHSQTLRAQNTGLGAVTIESVTIDAPFTVGATTPLQIDPASTYQFTVRFQPTTFGEFSGDLVVAWSHADGAGESIVCPFAGEVTADADEDGYDSLEAGGTDCDDHDALVNPGMEEQYYDGIDADCDGLSDYDQDGDGYESWVFNEDAETGGGDCQDVDPDIFPGADDAWYDGVDSNCDDADDWDQDGDGYPTADYGGDDCDDLDPLMNPETTEVFDGIDNDCDGVADDAASADEASVTITGAKADQAAGRSIAVGDWNGNGKADLVFGVWYYNYVPATTGTKGDSQGSVAIFMDESWTDGAVYSDASNVWDGEYGGDELGYAVTYVGDFTGDGVPELAMSAPAYSSKAGRVYLISGDDLEFGYLTSDAIATFDGVDDYQLGMGLATDTDLDGDGLSDLLMYAINSWDVYNYLALQYGGTTTGTVAWADFDATWQLQCGERPTSSYTKPYCGPPSGYGGAEQGGTETWAQFAHAGADFDGDGYHDVILGDPYNDDVAKQAGKAWILWGGSSRHASSDGSLGGAATAIAAGTFVKNFVGKAVGTTPDANGDGTDEVWIQDGDSQDLYLLLGSPALRDGAISLADDAQASFVIGDDVAGFTNTGDWSGDGIDDFGLVIDAKAGELMFFETQVWSGDMLANTVISASLVGGATHDAFGVGIAPRNIDLSSDGKTDLAVGDYAYDSVTGAVQLFYQR